MTQKRKKAKEFDHKAWTASKLADIGVSVEDLQPDDDPNKPPPPRPPKPPSAITIPQLPDADPFDRPMYAGALGDVISILAPDTEADPRAILAVWLTMLGNVMGRRLYLAIGAERHYPIIQLVLLGLSFWGKKGTAAKLAKWIMRLIDPGWVEHNIRTSINSGEGILGVVETIDEAAKERDTGNPDRPQGDKRAMFDLAEFATVLGKGAQPGSTILETLRDAYDAGTLENNRVDRKNRKRVKGATVSFVGAITLAELARVYDPIQMSTGTVNRWTMIEVMGRPMRGFADEPDEGPLRPHATTIKANLARAGMVRNPRTAADKLRNSDLLSERAMRLTPEAKEAAADLKEILAPPLRPGRQQNWLETGNARAFVQLLRLALIYAAVDGAEKVEVAHLRSAQDFLSETIGTVAAAAHELKNKVAERILIGLNEFPPPGRALNRTEITKEFFSNNCHNLDAALRELMQLGHITEKQVKRQGPGRRATYYSLTASGREWWAERKKR